MTPTPPAMTPEQRAALAAVYRANPFVTLGAVDAADQLEADGIALATAQAEIARLTAVLATAREDAGRLDTQEVHDAVAEALGDAMDCTRTWSAWSYGTMSANDFCNVADDYDRVQEIIAAIEAALTKGATT